MNDHSNYPQGNPEDGDGHDGPIRISRPDNAILVVLSETRTFLQRDEIVHATEDFPGPYKISYAAIRRRIPVLTRRGFVERVPGDKGFRITPFGEKAKHDI